MTAWINKVYCEGSEGYKVAVLITSSGTDENGRRCVYHKKYVCENLESLQVINRSNDGLWMRAVSST